MNAGSAITSRDSQEVRHNGSGSPRAFRVAEVKKRRQQSPRQERQRQRAARREEALRVRQRQQTGRCAEFGRIKRRGTAPDRRRSAW